MKLISVASAAEEEKVPTVNYENTIITTSSLGATPQVFYQSSGTNCEYDTARAEQAGAKSMIDVFCNQNHQDIEASIERMVKHINESQILMLSGGFSAEMSQMDQENSYISINE